MTFCQISMENVVWRLKHDSMCSLCLLEMHSLVYIEPAQRQNQVPTSHSWAIDQFWSQICKVMYLHWISIYNHALKSTASLNDFMSFATIMRPMLSTMFSEASGQCLKLFHTWLRVSEARSAVSLIVSPAYKWWWWKLNIILTIWRLYWPCDNFILTTSSGDQ